MRSRVFISCGQSSTGEIKIAKQVAQLLKRRGFDPYVAKSVQNVFEINSGIIEELKNSDCYLFINFRREKVGKCYRGSLFSNQEFAIAYALGFDRMIVVNQAGVKPEGMLAYTGCNTDGFNTHDQCLGAVKAALVESGWEPDFSRRLVAENIHFEDGVYRHFTGELLEGRFLSLDMRNRRTDLAAVESSGRLVGFRRHGDHSWIDRSLVHRSLLKASGRGAFSHTIFPGSAETFSLIFMGCLTGNGVRAEGVYLVSAIDLIPNPALELPPGEWELLYQFYAIGFPPLCVEVHLRYGAFADAAATLLRQYTAPGPADVPTNGASVKGLS